MPETMNYMLAGYSAAFIIFGILVGSILLRFRSLKADEAALSSLKEEIQAEQAASANQATSQVAQEA